MIFHLPILADFHTRVLAQGFKVVVLTSTPLSDSGSPLSSVVNFTHIAYGERCCQPTLQVFLRCDREWKFMETTVITVPQKFREVRRRSVTEKIWLTKAEIL